MTNTATRIENREMPPAYGRAAIQSINSDNRTFDVVFATDSEIPMWDWDRGSYVEILSMKPENVRMGRINANAPLLDNHWNMGARGVLGAVVPGSAKVDGSKATATIRMSKKSDVDGVWQDIQDGILTTVSVGYVVHRAALIDTAKNLYRADDWEPYEISIAPIPADVNAQIRSNTTNKIMFNVEIETTTTEDVEDSTETENNDNGGSEMPDDAQRDLDIIAIHRHRYKNI